MIETLRALGYAGIVGLFVMCGVLDFIEGQPKLGTVAWIFNLNEVA